MLQGFVFGIFLCWKSKLKGTHAFLGFTVLFLSFYLFWVLKYDFGFQAQTPKLQFLPVLFLWAIGPAFYAYLQSLFGKQLSKKSIQIFVGLLLLEQLYFNSCTVILWLNNWKVGNLNRFEFLWTRNVFNVEHIVGLTIIGIYLYKSYKLLKKGGVFYASNKIRNILLCFVLLWIIWVPYTVMDIVYYDFGFPPSGFYAFYLLFAVLTYGIGFYGFKINDRTYEKVAFPTIEKDILKESESDEAKLLASKIETTMQEGKPYLDPNLSLSSFATKVDLHPNKVSAIINSTLGYSFRDFINKYRVKEFEQQLSSYDLQSKTLLSLALDCGFNSKASFNRAFKKFNDCTPLEFVENFRKNRDQNVK